MCLSVHHSHFYIFDWFKEVVFAAKRLSIARGVQIFALFFFLKCGQIVKNFSILLFQ